MILADTHDEHRAGDVPSVPKQHAAVPHNALGAMGDDDDDDDSAAGADDDSVAVAVASFDACWWTLSLTVPLFIFF
jgi:hypothetical protein